MILGMFLTAGGLFLFAWMVLVDRHIGLVTAPFAMLVLLAGSALVVRSMRKRHS